LFVCLFVSKIKQKLLTGFHKIRRKGITRAKGSERLNSGGNPDHVTVRLGLAYDQVGQPYTLQARVIPRDTCIARYDSAPT